ncbi:KamA family radical SAM protein [Candidatus Dojkabacteria bacterium]|nr:KamA family radical SAM protein [Candidatus Dojkabacteria bacterium]
MKPLIPKHYSSLIDPTNPNDPLRLMAVPSKHERNIKPYELTDPIGDNFKSPIPGLIHRYPNRILLLTTDKCAIHCRFCFRKHNLESTHTDPKKVKAYLSKHQEVNEVILSGGDPLADLPALFSYLSTLNAQNTVKLVRIHTRVPVAAPKLITAGVIAKLAKIQRKKQVIIVVHVNHPREISKKTITLTKKLQSFGILMLSQTVLLKGVNDTLKTLPMLFTNLVQIGIKPYYLHHLDKAKGTHHFRVSIKTGLKLYKSLRGNLSGIAIPTYVLDLPGGYGKVPVDWLKEVSPGRYKVKTFEGKIVYYVDPV